MVDVGSKEGVWIQETNSSENFDWETYNQLRNSCIYSVLKARNEYHPKLLTEYTNNPQTFWTTRKNVFSEKVRIYPNQLLFYSRLTFKRGKHEKKTSSENYFSQSQDVCKRSPTPYWIRLENSTHTNHTHGHCVHFYVRIDNVCRKTYEEFRT